MKVRNFSVFIFCGTEFKNKLVPSITVCVNPDCVSCLLDFPPSLFLSRPRHLQCRHRRQQPTSRPSPPQLRLRLRPLSRLSTMTLEITGAKTVTSPLVPCLIFSRTCTANCTERFVLFQIFKISLFIHVSVLFIHLLSWTR